MTARTRREEKAKRLARELVNWQTHHLTDIPLRYKELEKGLLSFARREVNQKLKEAAEVVAEEWSLYFNLTRCQKKILALGKK